VTGFDPYALLEPLERNRVSYVIVGGFARVVHGSAEITRSVDIVPSPREDNLRRINQAVDELGGSGSVTPKAVAANEPTALATPTGTLMVVPTPWGTRGHDDLRIRANRENLGQGLRPRIASTVDLVRMLEAGPRPEDAERLHRLRRMIELDRQRTRRRGLTRER